MHQPVIVEYKKCNQIFKITYYHLKESCRCPVCAGGYLVIGYNSLADKYPNLIKFFKNKEEAKNISPGSHQEIDLICPICGGSKRK